jgi:general secretion pathway protein G
MTQLPMASSKPRSLVSEFVFLTAFSGSAVLLAGLLLVLYSLVIEHPSPRQDRARLELRHLQQALVLHRARTGAFPSEQEGLEALVREGSLLELPEDPWGRPYQYALRAGWPVVWSLGADGTPGGEGLDADLSSGRTLN